MCVKRHSIQNHPQSNCCIVCNSRRMGILQLSRAGADKQSFFHMRGFPRVLGCIDGTQIPIHAPTINQEEYLCRKDFTSINIQLVCVSNRRIIDAYVRFPGSVQDARILRESRLFEGCFTLKVSKC